MKTRIFIHFFVIATLAFSLCLGSEQTKVLCVDIGGSRIKAAVLYPEITLEELKKIEPTSFSSKEWLNEDLPLLFNAEIPGNIQDRIGSTFDELSIGVRSPVMDGTYCVVPKEHLPREMKKECQENAKCPISLECDTGIWARGALYWTHLINQNVAFPCLGITLGTGIGVAVFLSPSDIINVEISVINSPFTKMFALSRHQPIKQEYGRPAPHDAIGMPYFVWSQNERPYYDEKLTQNEFHERVLAFVEDMDDHLRNDQRIEIKSVMIGGGNSRFIDSSRLVNALNKQIILLSPNAIAQYGVPFDVISLLGCLMIRVNQPVKMLPSWEEMLPFYIN